MQIKDMEPFVRQAIVATLSEKDSKTDISTWFQTPDCRLFYIMDGYGKMEMEDRVFELVPGCVILLQAGTKYMWNVEKINYTAINFDYTMRHADITTPFHPVRTELFSDVNLIERVTFEDEPLLNAPVYLKDAMGTAQFFRMLATEFYIGQDYVTQLLSSCLKTLIISIVRVANAQMQKTHFTVQKIVQYIQNHYDEDLDNVRIAERIHLNPSYANRIFKQYTGTTMHKFLVHYRMNLALELLRTSNDSVSEIANSVGFSDIPHFVKAFKKCTGKTPTEYRHGDSEAVYTPL